MKRVSKYLALLLAGSLAVLTACGPEMSQVDVQHIPAVDGTKLDPLTDESGSSRAYVGTEVKVEGFNLDLVTRVSVGELDAEITEQTIKTLKFKIPELQLAQQDAPHAVDLNIYDAKGTIFTCPYYVTVPVTDARIEGYEPNEGTVGTEITLKGRNLEQITRVHFGGVTVEAADFTDVASGAVKFAVPGGDYAAGDSQIAISAEWGTSTIDVTGETPFALHTPRFDAVSQPEGTNSAIGDEVTFTGSNLDLVNGMKWGEYELIVTETEATAVTVKFPSSIDKADPVVATAALTALWGTPQQSTGVVSAWRVDTTPTGPATPVLTRMEAEDGGEDNKFYLGKTVTVVGENLASVEGFTVGGVEASLVGVPTDVEAKFTVPDGVTFTEATEVDVVALYNGGNQADFGKAKVYPFYYYKNVKIGARDASNAQIAFCFPDLGRTVSTDDWRTYDKYASAEVMKTKNELNKDVIGKAEYYEVLPYFFCSSGSSSFSLQGPCGSNSQLKNFKTSGGVSITDGNTWYGTPIVGFRNIEESGAKEEALATAAAVRDGSIGTMVFTTVKTATASPAYAFDGDATGSGDFKVGSVLLVQYSTYDWGKIKAGEDGICRTGFLFIKEVTAAATDDTSGTITFDMYWSKTLNE